MAEDTIIVRAEPLTQDRLIRVLRFVELPGKDWKVGDKIALVGGRWIAASGGEKIVSTITEIGITP